MLVVLLINGSAAPNTNINTDDQATSDVSNDDATVTTTADVATLSDADNVVDAEAGPSPSSSSERSSSLKSLYSKTRPKIDADTDNDNTNSHDIKSHSFTIQEYLTTNPNPNRGTCRIKPSTNDTGINFINYL